MRVTLYSPELHMTCQVRTPPRKPSAGAGQVTGTRRPVDRPQTPAGSPAAAFAMCTSLEDYTTGRRAVAGSEQKVSVLAAG